MHTRNKACTDVQQDTSSVVVRPERQDTVRVQDVARSLLAAATRKRLLLYQFGGGELVELRDFGLADISCLAWLGDNLCAGVRRECAP